MGLEVDQQAAAVERGVVAIDTDVGRQALHCRVLQDHLAQGLLAFAHGGERGGLRRFGNALDHPGVLHREEALGHHHVQEYGERQAGHGHQQRQRLALEYPLQGAAVVPDQPVDPGATGAVEPALFLFLGLALEQARAHHRRQGQRHHQGNQDRHRQGNGELAEQPADHVGHEQQRDQYRNQREGQRDQGEADLPGALERSLHGRLALLDVPGDVLQHDDGVVDHETGGDGQGHQRQVVDREAGQVHHAEGADQRQWHGDRRNEGGTEATQEHERDHYHQGDGDQQFVLHVLDRGADGLGAVGEHRNIQAGRQVVGDRRQQGLDTVDHFDDVGARLALDVQQHRMVFIGPGSQALVLRAVDDFGHVLETQWCTVVVG
ncbi:hypothetical protein D3C81_511020 [compost metagenome]